MPPWEGPDFLAPILMAGLVKRYFHLSGRSAAAWPRQRCAVLKVRPNPLAAHQGRMRPNAGKFFRRFALIIIFGIGCLTHSFLGVLPNGQRATFSALTIETWTEGYGLYAADTDGEIFESLDGGNTWEIIAQRCPGL
jgi:hypothetical protein